MKRLCFEDYEAFACAFADVYNDSKKLDDLADIQIIAKYDAAKEIVTELLCMGFPLFDIYLCNPEINGYDGEYYISLNQDGIWCEQALVDGRYLDTESCNTFIFDDCNSAILKHIGSSRVNEVYVGTCEDCDFNDGMSYGIHVGHDDECDKCEFRDECREMEMAELKGEIESAEDEMPGFTISKSDGRSSTTISFYSTDKELVKTMAEFYR